MSKPGSTSMEATDSETPGSHGVGQKRKPEWQPAHLPGRQDHLPTQNGHQPHPSTKQEKLIPRVRRRKPA